MSKKQKQNAKKKKNTKRLKNRNNIQKTKSTLEIKNILVEIKNVIKELKVTQNRVKTQDENIIEKIKPEDQFQNSISEEQNNSRYFPPKWADTCFQKEGTY